MHSDDVNGGPRNAEASDSREGLFVTDSEPTLRVPPPEGSLLLKSMLVFSEDWEVHVRPNELALPSEMPFDSWRELGSKIVFIANCSAWWIGDWLVYGEQAYGDRYEQAITDTSLCYQTLRNYAWVARRVLASRRRDTLSFGHHAEVAALSDDEQDVWLARAEQLHWSRNQLRRRLRAAQLTNRQAARGEQPASTRALRIDVPADRHDRWQSAAERTRCSVADWIIAALDRAADEDLATDRPSESTDPGGALDGHPNKRG